MSEGFRSELKAPPITEINFDKLHTALGERVKVLGQFFPHLDEYWKEQFVSYENEATPLPAMYHATRLSALTGIRLQGMTPFKEKNFKMWDAIYGTLNPHSAAVHILEDRTFDTYEDRPLVQNLNESDPPVILKIDVQNYLQFLLEKEQRKGRLRKIFDRVMKGRNKATSKKELPSVIYGLRNKQRNYPSSIDFNGGYITSENIPPQFISVLATGLLDRTDNTKIEEISLEEAYQRLLQSPQ